MAYHLQVKIEDNSWRNIRWNDHYPDHQFKTEEEALKFGELLYPDADPEDLRAKEV